MERVSLPFKKSDREISRVQMHIYVISVISFVISFLEGFSEPTPYTLILHLCASLALLCLVPGCFKRPVLVVITCFVLLTATWTLFMLADETPVQWLWLKTGALFVVFPALRYAIRAERFIRLEKKTVANQ